MANVINTSLTWSQEDAQKYFLEPLFFENNHLVGMDVITDVSGASILLDRYTSIVGITKAINTSADCFAADDTRTVNENVTLTLCRLEVEHAQQSASLLSHIKSQFLKKGVSRYDLSGTVFMEIMSGIIMQGIMRDFSTILWWGDTVNGATGTPQKLCNGVWKALDLAGQAGTLPALQMLTQGSTATITHLEAMLAARSTELATADNQIIYCSRAFADSYAKELRASNGSHTAAYADLQNGVGNLKFNGVSLVVQNAWDVDIATYHASLNAMAGGNAPDAATETMCAIWTAENNITVGTDFLAQDVDMWYNRDCKENRFRMLYSLGVQVKEPKMVVTSIHS
tara:strand:+ start:3519 stop:4541 length:1023 start_codon:yes stop_codon:yes gene_type:complete